MEKRRKLKWNLPPRVGRCYFSRDASVILYKDTACLISTSPPSRNVCVLCRNQQWWEHSSGDSSAGFLCRLHPYVPFYFCSVGWFSSWVLMTKDQSFQTLFLLLPQLLPLATWCLIWQGWGKNFSLSLSLSLTHTHMRACVLLSFLIVIASVKGQNHTENAALIRCFSKENLQWWSFILPFWQSE